MQLKSKEEVLIISDKNNHFFIKDFFSSITYRYTQEKYDNLFQKYEIIIIVVSNKDDEIYIDNLFNFCRNNKHKQILISLFRGDIKKEYIIKAIKSRFNDIVFDNSGIYPIEKKIENFFLTKQYNILLEKTKYSNEYEIFTYLKNFYKENKNEINIGLSFVSKYLKTYKKTILKTIYKTINKEKIPNNEHKKFLELLYISIIHFDNKNFNNLKIKIKKIAQTILYINHNKKIEEELFFKFENIINDIYRKRIEIKGFSWTLLIEKTINIYLLLFFRAIGIIVKKIRLEEWDSQRTSLNSNALHLLMISISHLQQNLTSPLFMLNTKISKTYKKIDSLDDEKKEKIINSIFLQNNKIQTDKIKDFMIQLSKLYSSYKSEEFNFNDDIKINNLKNFNYLKWLIDLIFVNGLNIKYPHIKTSIVLNNYNKNNTINVFENKLILAFYAIILNAINNNANFIDINIYKDNNYCCIDIKNNGKKFKANLIKPFDNNNNNDLTLFIAKEELEFINYNLDILDSRNGIRIKIPLKEK